MKTKTMKSSKKPSGNTSHSAKPATKVGKKRKVKKVMDEWKEGNLKTNVGKPVKDQKQAVAIALSESGQSYKDKKARR
jgi:hypothetical protein